MARTTVEEGGGWDAAPKAAEPTVRSMYACMKSQTMFPAADRDQSLPTRGKSATCIRTQHTRVESQHHLPSVEIEMYWKYVLLPSYLLL